MIRSIPIAPPYNNRGNAHDEKGDRGRAVADYDQAIRLDPKFTAAYYNRGMALRRKRGDLERAIASFDQAISSTQERRRLQQPWQCLCRTGRLRPRRRGFRPCAEARSAIFPGLQQPRQCLSRRRTTSAPSPIQQSRGAGANNALPLFNRASALHFAGKSKEALPDINKSIELDGKKAPAFSARGLIYEKLGEKDKAIADFRRAVALEPNLKEPADGLIRLGVRPRR